jgi:hypothetical protein
LRVSIQAVMMRCRLPDDLRIVDHINVHIITGQKYLSAVNFTISFWARPTTSSTLSDPKKYELLTQ